LLTYRKANVFELLYKPLTTFPQAHDYIVLRDGTSSQVADLEAEWLRVGTEKEPKNQHIKLKDYLSYDEMMLASLLGTSGPSLIVNTGHRRNRADVDDNAVHEQRGIMVRLVGARLHKAGQMDAALMLPPDPSRLVSPKIRQQDPGVTRLFREFFGAGKQRSRFDVAVYKARTRLTVETFLLGAGDRAAQSGLKAHAHLVISGVTFDRNARKGSVVRSVESPLLT
jgi:hypothetical protein